MKILTSDLKPFNKRGSICIVNEKGVPGELTAIVMLQNGQFGLLGNYHVIFGGGAKKGTKIWIHEISHGKPEFIEVGKAHDGYLGSVQSRAGSQVFIDCAIVLFNDFESLPRKLRTKLIKEKSFSGWGEAFDGSRVSKWGATTGLTLGTITDLHYPDYPHIEGKTWTALNQLLISSQNVNSDFSASGDSGAAILNEEKHVVGMLWGTTNNGDGLACPIAPVIEHLGICFDCNTHQGKSGNWLSQSFNFLRNRDATR